MRDELRTAAEGSKSLTDMGFFKTGIQIAQSEGETRSSSMDNQSVLNSAHQIDQFSIPSLDIMDHVICSTIELRKAIESLENRLRSKTAVPIGQTLIRHRAVLYFLKLQESRKPEETRESLALTVARCFQRGVYFSRKIISWEITWRYDGQIEEV